MSRTHDFLSWGEAGVEMVCGLCERREWVRVRWEPQPKVKYREDEDPCLAQLAASQSDWRYTHDAYVCGQVCADAWWAA